MSSYTGLYVQRLSNGEIFSVQVADTGGNSLPLNPDDYVNRGIRPPIGELPDSGKYHSSRQSAPKA